MERHEIPKYRQSAWLAGAMGLSYAQAHRRMNGAAAWTLEELEKVAELFGESLADVVALGHAHGSVTGILRLGSARVACDLWIGDEIETPAIDTLVAIRTSSGWAAVSAVEAIDKPAYAVERLRTRPETSRRKVVAVLDDDRDLTDSICAHLQYGGYEARPFYATSNLEASLASQRYDGFVIDWIVGETSTLDLIAAVRAQDDRCPIVALTAQVISGAVQESDIADAVARFNLVFSEKPVRMAILSASLARAFAAK